MLCFFYAATETARDEATKYYKENTEMAKNPNENTVLNIDWKNLPQVQHDPDNKFLMLLEVFINNFIALIQCTDKDKLTWSTCCVLHVIKCFSTSRGHWKYYGTTNIAKGARGGGSMGNKKGNTRLDTKWNWKDHTTTKNKRSNTLITLLQDMNRKIHTSVKDLQCIQGKLQFASIIIPLGKPLLGPIDHVIVKAEQINFKKIKINTMYYKAEKFASF